MIRNVVTSLSGIALVLLVPLVADAGMFSPDGGPVGTLLRNIVGFINQVLIPFILGVGFLFFVWGMFLYFIKGGDDDEAKTTGKSYIVYAAAGFVLIFIFWGLISVLVNGTGLMQTENSLQTPRAPGPR